MNSNQLKMLFQSSAATCPVSKTVFLEHLYRNMTDVGCQLTKLQSLLDRRETMPVEKSRFDLADLSRRLESVTWDEDAAAISGAYEIVRECLTVSAGDCDNCMGDEMVYMWESDQSVLVKNCGLCGQTLDLSGMLVPESPTLVEPTDKQLSDYHVA